MKKLFLFVSASILIGCSKPLPETETLLVCKGKKSGSISAFVGTEAKTSFFIYKSGEKVVRVKTEHAEFTLEKKDVRTKNHKGPLYRQLLIETDKLILRTEVTEDNQVLDTEIFNTGKYRAKYALGWEEGECVTQNKAF